MHAGAPGGDQQHFTDEAPHLGHLLGTTPQEDLTCIATYVIRAFEGIFLGSEDLSPQNL